MSRELAYLHNRTFAVALVEEDGSDDGAWAILSGIAKWYDDQLFVHRGMDVPEFPIPREAWCDIVPVPPDGKQFLHGADYTVALLVGPLLPDEDPDMYDYTGYDWPDANEQPRESI